MGKLRFDVCDGLRNQGLKSKFQLETGREGRQCESVDNIPILLRNTLDFIEGVIKLYRKTSNIRERYA